ncbi:MULTISPECIES: rhomboid family intramembrane serine protease [Streptomyces]|uniref:rhomboid family intramembrane serine protease n=1 Tax=Streptomyces TaxID=1883 RepID=UPI001964652F|nr:MULTISPECIES: rhomboid family intramembrane serine protease [Streptomyces]QRX92971.1 rhomboid family intramembrane serine protease [Streptomyces noursei]UJB42685.1 rhomboid family intramembrane serine protease [Streptomyces sp. A1-5]
MTPRTARARPALVLMLGWVALLWVLEGLDTVTGNALDAFGIQPRDPAELVDVIPAAFIHFGFGHLAANTLPLLVLGFVAALRSGIRRFLGAALLIIVVSGLGVWLTAAPHSNTAGASGVVFGLFGYLLVRGFIERKLLDVGIGVTVGLIYGSILWGALPTTSGISWQGHLFGLVGGVLAAFVLRERGRAVRPAGAVVGPVP